MECGKIDMHAVKYELRVSAEQEPSIAQSVRIETPHLEISDICSVNSVN
jgi:hypothetical protein